MVADNTHASDAPNVATRKVTYSGDAGVDLQVAALALVAGSDDAKTVADVDGNSGNKSAGTVRVVLATDQPALTTPMPVADGGGSLTVDGSVTANAGTNLNTSALATETTQSAGNTLIGAVNETAPATDTASSGLNGRLQRIAQRLTSIIGLLPTALGAGGGLKVDGSGTALPVSGTVAVTNADLTTIAGAVRAEDAASADGHTGIAALAVRKATPANTSGTDGDYENLQVSAGRLWASATIDAALPAGNANIGDVDVATVPADPFGANADAIVAAGAVGSIQAKLRRATQGIEDLKTGVVLATGANAIGKLAAGTASIGDIANIGTSVTPGTGAANLGKAEDAAHTTGDTGVMALGVRADTLAPTAGSTGDYLPALFDQLGAQYVVQEERIQTITVNPTVSNAAIYASGDVVGGLLTFANAARFSGGPVTIESLAIICKTPALNMALELWLFDTTFTAVADNAAVSYSDAEALTLIGVFLCGPWVDNALNSISTRSGIGHVCVIPGTSLFGQLVVRGTPTLTSTSDISVRLGVRQG